MILIFLGSMRATVAVFFSIPAFGARHVHCALQIGGSSINTMVLGGLALALSRLIDNSVVVLENIYRHLELGDRPWSPRKRADARSRCRCWPRRLTTVVVFFPGHAALWRQQVPVFGSRWRRCGRCSLLRRSWR
jgi:multidrug efflux pump subunit AcrB